MISRSVLVRFVFFWRYKTRPVRTTCRLWTFRTIWLLCLTWAIALMARSLILGWQSTMSATYIRSGVIFKSHHLTCLRFVDIALAHVTLHDVHTESALRPHPTLSTHSHNASICSHPAAVLHPTQIVHTLAQEINLVPNHLSCHPTQAPRPGHHPHASVKSPSR